MDAGILTEENLKEILEQGYDYISVSRIQPKEFDRLTEDATLLEDNRGNKIEYEEDAKNGKTTDIRWTRQAKKENPKGEYFLRYSKSILNEKEIWDAYNLTREVESSFRCLKTDLNIRPIHHQKDAYIEPHIWLGIIAYQVVNYIRQVLKDKNINYSWSTIVEKMKNVH